MKKIIRRSVLPLLLIGICFIAVSCEDFPPTVVPPTTSGTTESPRPPVTVQSSFLENGLEYVIDSDISCHIIGIGTYSDTVLRIPNEDSEGRVIAYIDIGAFSGNTNITEVDMGSSVTEIRQSAFRGCSSVKKITMSEKLRTVGSFAFYGCTGLESISFPKELKKLGENALTDCTSLLNISVEDGNKAYKAQDGILYSADMSTLICYPIGRSTTSFIVPEGVKTIGNSSFKGCVYIKIVTLSSTVENIADHAFRECTALETLTLSAVTNRLGVGCCYNCKALKTVNYPGTKETWDDDEKMNLTNTWDSGAGKYTVKYDYKG